MTLPEYRTSRLFRGTSNIISTVQSRDPLTSNRKTRMPEFKITFFRLVAGLRCPVVLGPRSTYVPALRFGAQNISPPTERISSHIVYRCIYAIGHLLARYRTEGVDPRVERYTVVNVTTWEGASEELLWDFVG
jgi:hypothetical protein